MKRLIIFLLCVVQAAAVQAQVGTPKKVALLLPLFLDSAFDATNTYRFGTSFPKYLNPGLEFYLGAQAAFDSLNRAGAQLDVDVIDLRATEPLSNRLKKEPLAAVHMFIAASNASETRVLAEEARRRKVPLISASLPNDAGIEDNPYYFVLNSTLRTHCEGLYRHIQKTAHDAKVLLLTRPGAQETQVREYFQDAARSLSGSTVNIQVQELNDDLNDASLLQLFDSTRKNIVIAGSLEEEFALQAASRLKALGKAYQLQLLGMPTWDGFNLRKAEYKGLELLYTTPFSYNRSQAVAQRLTKAFQEKQNGRPTDMYFRGYETVLRFCRLLLDAGTDTASDLSRRVPAIFTPFDIVPVFLNHTQPTLDYFENKHLYFIRVQNGSRSMVL